MQDESKSEGDFVYPLAMSFKMVLDFFFSNLVVFASFNLNDC